MAEPVVKLALLRSRSTASLKPLPMTLAPRALVNFFCRRASNASYPGVSVSRPAVMGLPSRRSVWSARQPSSNPAGRLSRLLFPSSSSWSEVSSCRPAGRLARRLSSARSASRPVQPARLPGSSARALPASARCSGSGHDQSRLRMRVSWSQGPLPPKRIPSGNSPNSPSPNQPTSRPSNRVPLPPPFSTQLSHLRPHTLQPRSRFPPHPNNPPTPTPLPPQHPPPQQPPLSPPTTTTTATHPPTRHVELAEVLHARKAVGQLGQSVS